MQVIKEFSKNRVFLIRERINDVANEMDMLTNVTPLEKLIPILNGKEIYMKTQEIQKDYIRYINLYRDQLKIIKDELKKLVSDDSFFNLIYNLPLQYDCFILFSLLHTKILKSIL